MSCATHSHSFFRIGVNVLVAMFISGLAACGGGGGGANSDASSNPAPSASVDTPFSAQVTTAPENGASISGIVNLEVKGSNLASVELLPADSNTPKLALFTISPDKTTATASFDTTRLPEGDLAARISAISAPSDTATAVEIAAMPARSWNIKNGSRPDPAPFSAQLVAAPADGATISGTITLEVRGSNIKNVELLPSQGYVPRLAVFTVSSDGKLATATLDTQTLPDGLLVARISSFDAPAGQPANEIVSMPARSWIIKNNATPAGFTASLTNAPADGETISGTVHLEITGSGIQNVELLPQEGYVPRYGVFNVSSDNSKATLDFDSTSFSNGAFAVRISAFNKPAGSAMASEIIVLKRTWKIKNWTLVNLGSLSSQNWSTSSAINESGEVVGYSLTANATHAFMYKQGKMVDINIGANSFARAINNNGQVVGDYFGPTGIMPFLYDNSLSSSLNLLSGITESHAYGINDESVIVGFYDLDSGGLNRYAFIYKNGVMSPIITQFGYAHGEATAINNQGQILIDIGGQGYIYKDGYARYIGALDSAPNEVVRPYAMNNKGEVVGYTNGTGFLYTQGKMIDLGALVRPEKPGFMTATAINDLTQVVGYFMDSDGYQTYLYKDGELLYLNSLPAVKAAGLKLWEATGINNSGQIACWGYGKDGKQYAVVLTPP